MNFVGFSSRTASTGGASSDTGPSFSEASAVGSAGAVGSVQLHTSTATGGVSMTMTTTMNAFVQSNNEGIALLQRGDGSHHLLAALACFRRAMDIVKIQLDSKDNDDDIDVAVSIQETNQNHSSSDYLFSNIFQSVPIPTSSMGLYERRSGGDGAGGVVDVGDFDMDDRFDVLTAAVSPNNSFSFYSRAFYVNPNCPHLLLLQCTKIDLAIVCLFNMAIALQLHGFYNGSIYLQKAAGLYNMILSLLEHQTSRRIGGTSTSSVVASGGECRRTCSTTSANVCDDEHHPEHHQHHGVYHVHRTLLLGLYSNLGHIYSHFCREHDALNCRLHLIHLLNQSYNRVQVQSSSQQLPIQVPTSSTDLGGSAAPTTTITTSTSTAVATTTRNTAPVYENDDGTSCSVFVLNAFLISNSSIGHFAPSA